MAGHELADALAERGARGRHDVRFGAARIGDERRLVEKRCDAREQRFGLRDGRGEQDEVGAGQRVRSASSSSSAADCRRRRASARARPTAGERPTPTTMPLRVAVPRSCKARASDPPIKPTPKMTSLLKEKAATGHR